jgi:undecaprenyl-diphosphatase
MKPGKADGKSVGAERVTGGTDEQPEFLRPGRRSLGDRAVVAGVVVVLAVIPLGALAVAVRRQWAPLCRVDIGTLDVLHRFAISHPHYVGAMRVLSFGGGYEVFMPLFALIAVWLLLRGHFRHAAFVLITPAAGWVLNSRLKHLIVRDRPAFPDAVARSGAPSFPSGHAQAVVVTSVLLLSVLLPLMHGRALRRHTVLAAALMSVLIGYSRLALGVHYLSDLIAGYLSGVIWVAVAITVFGVWPTGPARGEHPAGDQRIGRATGVN